jgi:hypothetical protein
VFGLIMHAANLVLSDMIDFLGTNDVLRK